MDTFEIFTIGNAYFLEKIFHAIKIIFSSGLTGVLKIVVAISLTLLVIRAMLTSNFAVIGKWVIGVIVLTGFFLNTKAKVVINDGLPDQHGRMQAAYIVDDVPWGLAWMAHATSNVGKVMMQKFETSFAGVTNNQTYSKYGILFGSKIIEDASKLRITNADLRSNMIKFYRQCMVPDLRMGYTRKNGYTLQDLAKTEDIGEFLKNHSSRARSIHMTASITKHNHVEESLSYIFERKANYTENIDGYISCNKAAHVIYDLIEAEVKENKHIMANHFAAQYMNDKTSSQVKNQFFESVLTDTYGSFLKASKDASELLKQNIMINAVKDSARSVSQNYSQVATEEMTRSSMYSVSQVFQKFIPIIRSVFECLFYGVAPLVIILMVTPIGLEVLKNYAFSFVYLQMWPPMYAILYVITESWSRFSASGLKHNMKSFPQIESINYDISMVSGYMLALIPVLSMFITKGLVASVGNMATSMMYIPQSAAVNSSDQAVKGNYSIGNSSLDNHSYDNTNAHKFDDNKHWSSGMRSFQQLTGSMEKHTPSNHKVLDMSGSVHNLGGLVNVGWGNAVGNSLSSSETEATKELETASKDYTKSMSSGMSKVLGYDSNYSKGTSAYEAINKSMSAEQRQSSEYVKGVVDRVSKDHSVSSTDVLQMSMLARGGVNILGNGVSVGGEMSTSSKKDEVWRATQDAMKDRRFSESLGQIVSFGQSQNIQQNEGSSDSVSDSIRSDFHEASSANSRVSVAQDKLQSIEHSRRNYENNSQSVDLNLNNKFANWGIEKYGIEHFEKMITNQPEEVQKKAQEFLKDEIGSIEQFNFVAPEASDLSLDGTDKERVNAYRMDNENKIHAESGGLSKQAPDRKFDLDNRYIHSRTNARQASSEHVDMLQTQRGSIEREQLERENKVEKKVDGLAIQQLGSRIVNAGGRKKLFMKKTQTNDEGNKDGQN